VAAHLVTVLWREIAYARACLMVDLTNRKQAEEGLLRRRRISHTLAG